MGLSRKNPASGQGGTWTRGRWNKKPCGMHFKRMPPRAYLYFLQTGASSNGLSSLSFSFLDLLRERWRGLLTSSWFLFKGLIVFIHEAMSPHQMDIVLKFSQYPSFRRINILNGEDRFMHLLWLNFIHVSIWFLLLILSSTSSKQRNITFEQRIKLNYNTTRK